MANLFGGSNADILIGGTANDRIFGGNGDDTLIGGISDELLGNFGNFGSPLRSGNDLLDGGAGNDFIYGGEGRDTLIGGTGADLLVGGTGVNSLDGGTGNDTLFGGGENDTLTGGTGKDQFVFASRQSFLSVTLGVDTIEDFDPRTSISDRSFDKIVLDKRTFTALQSTAGAGFSAACDFDKGYFDHFGTGIDRSSAAIVYNRTNGFLYYNPDGAGPGAALHFATLSGAPTISANDFTVVSGWS
jgi:Ca2+-binding RTX toxin-like protein